MKGVSVEESTPLLLNTISPLGKDNYYVSNSGKGEKQHQQHYSLSLSNGEDSVVAVAEHDTSRRHATSWQTALNVAKCCMGTGTLALPYAASQGGYVLSSIGFILMGLWNLYCVDRMIQCGDLLLAIMDQQQQTNAHKIIRKSSSEDSMIPSDTTLRAFTFGKVVWAATGTTGLIFYDIIMVILMLGIIVAYEGSFLPLLFCLLYFICGSIISRKLLDCLLTFLFWHKGAALSFISRTPLSSGSSKMDAFWVAMSIIPISCVPDISFLSKFSALGIGTIILTFSVIFAYGLFGEHQQQTSISPNIINSLWPQDAAIGVANWFGVAAFSFGVVPITYNIQESMAEPSLMIQATRMGLGIVILLYLVISNGVAALFSTSNEPFQGDVLRYLPNTWVAASVRLAMAFVVLFTTAPIIVVCCGELIEGRVFGDSYKAEPFYRIITRAGICVFTTSVSVYVPGFVIVISVIGCCCVALVSFALPPLFFILLTWKKNELKPVVIEAAAVETSDSTEKWAKKADVMPETIFTPLSFDYLMLAFGVVTVFVSSYLTIGNVLLSRMTLTEVQETSLEKP